MIDGLQRLESISNKLGEHAEKCRGYSVIGIRAEVNRYFKSLDEYLRIIKEQIEKEPISEAFKNEILTKCHPIKYRGKLLYVFECQADQPEYYDKRLIIRRGSHNHNVENASEEFNGIMKKFYQR